MLVSHEYKFIYLKSRKTASTSLERYFLPYCKNGLVDLKRAHKPAIEIKELVGEEVWNSYTKICAIRNPWDKMVSYYFWKKRLSFVNKILHKLNPKWSNYNEAHQLDFKGFIQKQANLNIDTKIFYINSQWQDYEFIRYENLYDDLKKVCDLIGIPYEKSKLGNHKSMYRPKKSHHQKFYDDETRDLVRDAYSIEIEKIGYPF
ncbi:MAG: sulfotransferase family 2 domain-containing protein [Cyclobacteriaceae bacterium]